MEYTTDERIKLICDAVINEKGVDPVKIFNHIAKCDFVRMHGPEHHVLDGACVLAAFYNALGGIDLKKGIEHIAKEGVKMPGAMCGYWGVCGAVTSVGAALGFIDSTGPLTTDGSWGKHMEYTAKALFNLAETKGPRCCKRDGYIALKCAVEFLNENYNVNLECSDIKCGFYPKNEQCIKERCLFYNGKN